MKSELYVCIIGKWGSEFGVLLSRFLRGYILDISFLYIVYDINVHSLQHDIPALPIQIGSASYLSHSSVIEPIPDLVFGGIIVINVPSHKDGSDESQKQRITRHQTNLFIMTTHFGHSSQPTSSMKGTISKAPLNIHRCQPWNVHPASSYQNHA